MQLTPTDRTRHRRLPKRGSFDRDEIYSIVDEALMCHVGFAVDGHPWVIPTIHARLDDEIVLHGAVANHMLRTLDDGVETCVTVTIVDGLVLARSHFHHSMNYRSAMIFGRAMPIVDPDAKRRALHALVEHVVAGRTGEARPPSESELRATLVLSLPITEASAKVRTGGPVDDDDDLALPVWAGVLPCALTFGAPVAEPGIAGPVPEYVTGYARG